MQPSPMPTWRRLILGLRCRHWQHAMPDHVRAAINTGAHAHVTSTAAIVTRLGYIRGCIGGSSRSGHFILHGLQRGFFCVPRLHRRIMEPLWEGADLFAAVRELARFDLGVPFPHLACHD